MKERKRSNTGSDLAKLRAEMIEKVRYVLREAQTLPATNQTRRRIEAKARTMIRRLGGSID